MIAFEPRTVTVVVGLQVLQQPHIKGPFAGLPRDSENTNVQQIPCIRKIWIKHEILWLKLIWSNKNNMSWNVLPNCMSLLDNGTAEIETPPHSSSQQQREEMHLAGKKMIYTPTEQIHSGHYEPLSWYREGKGGTHTCKISHRRKTSYRLL